MYTGQLLPLGQADCSINQSKVIPPWHKATLKNVSWSPPAKHYPQTLITEEQRESGVMQVSNQKQNKAG